MPDPQDAPRTPEPSYGPSEDGEFLTDGDEAPIDPDEPGIETETGPGGAGTLAV